MVDNVRRECIMSMYEIYPLSRKLVFDTFDKKKYDITRTQQIIMLSLCIEGTLTMSQLASKINTSNEQATRAVAQLVDKGFVIRMQNPDNRRVINIRLTDEAMRFMDEDCECYCCMVDLDEDEAYRSMSDSEYSCPYYRLDDEYAVVRKQN